MITPTRLPLGLLPAPLPESKMSPCPVRAAAAAADATIMAEIINAKKRIKNRESNREIPIVLILRHPAVRSTWKPLEGFHPGFPF